MSEITSLRDHSLKKRSTPSRRKAIILIAGVSLAAVMVIFVTFNALLPPSVKIEPKDGSREVQVDTSLKISTSWMRGDVQNVEVKETLLDPMGAPISERIIKGSLDGGVFVPDDGSLLKPDARYEVTVNAELLELSLSGVGKQKEAAHSTFYTVITPSPIFTEESQVVEIDQPIVVEFNTPIEDFTYNLGPNIESSYSIDESNPTRVLISFNGYEQGQQFSLEISSATAQNGVAMKEPHTQIIKTTDPLKVVFVPGDGESAVSQGKRPTLTFSEEVRNPDVAQSLLSIDPDTAGSWEWISSDTIEYTPQQDWVEGAEITIGLKGGTEGLRGNSGSFLREDVESTFTIKPSKMIDVNLTTQTVTLYEHDQQVRTMICSSGSDATPSLTGTYAVYAKAEKLDMEGEGYSAPDVPWVLMFNGDYTIHGNYWTTTFGVPSSHGCVGLPLNDAEYLYKWAPIGTIVSIHY